MTDIKPIELKEDKEAAYTYKIDINSNKYHYRFWIFDGYNTNDFYLSRAEVAVLREVLKIKVTEIQCSCCGTGTEIKEELEVIEE